jgi:hypothetical protein
MALNPLRTAIIPKDLITTIILAIRIVTMKKKEKTKYLSREQF